MVGFSYADFPWILFPVAQAEGNTMKSLFRILSLSCIAAFSLSASADVILNQRIVGPGSSSVKGALSLPEGTVTNVTITADSGFAISSIVTNGVPAGEFLGEKSASLSLALSEDTVLYATFVKEDAWWLDPFVRNAFSISQVTSSTFPEECVLDGNGSYLALYDGDYTYSHEVHLYSASELISSVDATLSPLASAIVEPGEEEFGDTLAISSDLGIIVVNPLSGDSFTVLMMDSFSTTPLSVPVDNLGDFDLESLDGFCGGAFGSDGLYISNGESLFLFEPRFSEDGLSLLYFHIADSWEFPASLPYSINAVNHPRMGDMIYGLSDYNDGESDGNATLYVLHKATGRLVVSPFFANTVDYDDVLCPTVIDCYSPVQVTGLASGTPRLTVKDDWYTYIFDLTSYALGLVSHTPVKVLEGCTDEEDLYDASVSSIGGIAVTDDESRMFCLARYFVEPGDGEWEDESQIVRLKVFEHMPEQFEVTGLFEYADENTVAQAGTYLFDRGAGAEVVFAPPQGYIKSVTVNGVRDTSISANASEYRFTSDSLERHACVKMEVFIGVAKIGEENYSSIEDALRNAEDGDTVEVVLPVPVRSDCSISSNVILDTCGFTVTNTAVITIEGGGSLSFTNSSEVLISRLFVNRNRVVVSDGAVLDLYRVTTGDSDSSLWKADLRDGGSFSVKSGGLLILPYIFRWWCFDPWEIESEIGNWCYSFLDGTEVGAKVRLNKILEGDRYLVCTSTVQDSLGVMHYWNSLVATYDGVGYYSITGAVAAAERDSWAKPVVLLCETSMTLPPCQDVLIDLNGYGFNPVAPAGYAVTVKNAEGEVITYYAARKIDAATITVSGATFNGEPHYPSVTSVVDGDDYLVENVDYIISGGPFTSAGSHSFTIAGTNRYASAVTQLFTIAPAKLTGVKVEQTEELFENGEAQSAEVSAVPQYSFGKVVYFTYSATEDGTYTATVPSFTQAGEYTVYFKANADCHEEHFGTFKVVIGEGGPDSEPVQVGGVSVEDSGYLVVTVNGTLEGRYYTAFSSADLSVPAEEWAKASESLPGTGAAITFRVPVSGPKLFVRVSSSRRPVQ